MSVTYGVITVGSEQSAIEMARQLTQAANSVHKDFSLHDIEQMSIAQTLCFLRDRIQIQAVGGQNG